MLQFSADKLDKIKLTLVLHNIYLKFRTNWHYNSHSKYKIVLLYFAVFCCENMKLLATEKCINLFIIPFLVPNIAWVIIKWCCYSHITTLIQSCTKMTNLKLFSDGHILEVCTQLIDVIMQYFPLLSITHTECEVFNVLHIVDSNENFTVIRNGTPSTSIQSCISGKYKSYSTLLLDFITTHVFLPPLLDSSQSHIFLPTPTFKAWQFFANSWNRCRMR